MVAASADPGNESEASPAIVPRVETYPEAQSQNRTGTSDTSADPEYCDDHWSHYSIAAASPPEHHKPAGASIDAGQSHPDRPHPGVRLGRCGLPLPAAARPPPGWRPERPARRPGAQSLVPGCCSTEPQRAGTHHDRSTLFQDPNLPPVGFVRHAELWDRSRCRSHAPQSTRSTSPPSATLRPPTVTCRPDAS